ncbi:hypothetical protein P4E94_13760 [Pontiellaceae bacterium B12219]|nr:hypothetical protein [Pontiellaceae bacterium B12219]
MKWLGIVCLLAGTVLAAPDQERFAHITQHSVDLDLSSGEIFFNGEPMDAKQFTEQVKQAYSITVSAFSRSDDDYGGVDELFGGADVVEPENKEPTIVPLQRITDLLTPIEEAGMDPERVQLEMYLDPKGRIKLSSAQMEWYF